MRVTDQWNLLPDEVVKVEDLNIFKNALDKFWEGSNVYFDHECNVQLTTSSRRIIQFRRAQPRFKINVNNTDLMLEA